ncbi:glycoside hydrolase family 76 [Lecanosticta acicola]|uniref:Glycoside hydrolase family 76 n=1 Tax=Lecanosticta acicola TaxID=111012 RepID=A0AAI8YYX2_9PEZI|nr:glycoside hydrolase family 76 [Lecanosticta acicola]
MFKSVQGTLAFAGLVALSTSSSLSARDVTTANAESAYNALMQWYNQQNGLWIPSTGWWNSANCLTVIADLAAVDGSLKNAVTSVFKTTYTKAQQYNSGTLTVAKAYGVQGAPSGPSFQSALAHTQDDWQAWLPVSHYNFELSSVLGDLSGVLARDLTERANTGFLDGYYDDEGWWALGWIAAYDLTGNTTYLSQAQTIFNDMNAVFGKTNCSTINGVTGGIWWDKSHSYVNAIANELFLDVAAHLANRVKNSNVNYLSIAKQQWAWFQASGLKNSGNTINDGLDQSSCTNNNGTVWSYNQGVILGGLAELTRATGDTSYVTAAQQIADAGIAKLATPNGGILQDPCEPSTSCGADGSQFKGVFTRNLQILQKQSPQSRYATFLDNNANAIWANDRNSNSQLSLKWNGPFVSPANASTQSSAMDALVASLAT